MPTATEIGDATVWGEPSTSLPIRPLSGPDLRELRDQDEIAQVRIPTDGAIFGDDEHPGPEIIEEPGTISEFLVIAKDESVTSFRYGYPEVIEGELELPHPKELALQQGFVKWWRGTVRFDEVRVEGLEVEIEDEIWQYYADRSEPL